MHNVFEKASKIRLVIFDVDGVLTDGSLFINHQGEEYKAFNSRDGLGMKMLQQSGVELAIITGRTSKVVEFRMKSLGITQLHQGCIDKLPPFEILCHDLQLQPEEVAFVGDDLIDVPVMRRCGLSVAVADAHPLLKPYADWQTPSVGGRGAARDVCELVMQAQNTWNDQLKRFHLIE